MLLKKRKKNLTKIENLLQRIEESCINNQLEHKHGGKELKKRIE